MRTVLPKAYSRTLVDFPVFPRPSPSFSEGDDDITHINYNMNFDRVLFMSRRSYGKQYGHLKVSTIFSIPDYSRPACSVAIFLLPM